MLRFAPLAMLSALMLYGLMEYNLADADVVLLYSLAMAMASFIYTNPNPEPLRQPKAQSSRTLDKACDKGF